MQAECKQRGWARRRGFLGRGVNGRDILGVWGEFACKEMGKEEMIERSVLVVGSTETPVGGRGELVKRILSGLERRI